MSGRDLYLSDQDRRLVLRWAEQERRRIAAERRLTFWHWMSVLIIATEVVAFLWLGWTVGAAG